MKKLSPSLIKLTHLLNDGHYHDGTTIGLALNITRSAVWKMIKKLENYGVEIDSAKGKGYALREPLILLNKTIIKKNLFDNSIALDVFETIASTNQYLKLFYRDTKPRVCLAEQQTGGKGRLQRDWYSPFGLNLYFSFFYPIHKEVSELAGLSLVVSLAVIKTANAFGLPSSLSVKWPNDIFYDNKKVSGNLIEIQAETHGTCAVIIGIGINVNMLHDADACISQPWTSLRKIANEYIDRNQLCVALINTLLVYLKKFEKHGLAAFVDEWKQVDCLLGKTISLKGLANKITGVARGINEDGHLLLELDNGEIKGFSSGDTTILKHT